MEKPRNYILNDVEVNWPHLVTPQSPFGTSQYEIQIATTDGDKAAELIANHIPMKEKDGKFVASLKRKEFKANGESNGKVRVVDNNKQPLDASIIGNGSVANIILFQMPYDRAGRQGIMSSLTAIQVTDLVEFSGSNSVDFEMVGGMEPTVTSSGEVVTDELF
jgi:hypothetical protein